MVQYFSKVFDELWVLPVYKHVFESKSNSFAPFSDRMAMATICFSDIENVKIKEIELLVFNEWCGKDGRPGSVDLLHYLRRNFGEHEFSLVLGGDTFNDLCCGKWKESEFLLGNVEIHVVDRPAVELTERVSQGNIVYHRVEKLRQVSSTLARRSCVGHDMSKMQEFITLPVAKYICDNGLYMN